MDYNWSSFHLCTTCIALIFSISQQNMILTTRGKRSVRNEWWKNKSVGKTPHNITCCMCQAITSAILLSMRQCPIFLVDMLQAHGHTKLLLQHCFNHIAKPSHAKNIVTMPSHHHVTSTRHVNIEHL